LKSGYEMVGKDRGEMGRVKTKFKKVIQLFNEKTGEAVRTISFRSPKEFNEFVKGFKEMRYPGYSWRCRDKVKKKEELKYQVNKGEYCSASGCNNKARVKGLCAGCYNLKRKKETKGE
jgi:hypothetical protein